MSEFNPGDKVLINGTLSAVIDFYDDDLDVVRYVTTANSSTDTTTAHISQTKIQHLVSDVEGADEKPQAEELPLDERATVVADGDDVTEAGGEEE